MVWQPLAPDEEDSQGPGEDGLPQDLWGVRIRDAFFIEDQLADAGGTLCPTTLSRLPNIHKNSVIL